MSKLDRIALVVDDVHAVAGDLERIFGMQFQIFDVASMGIRVGLGNQGVELVEKIGPSTVEHLWRGPLAALVVRVDDIDEITRRMSEIGVEIDHEVNTPGGVREVSFGTNFRGMPLVICDGDEDTVTGVGASGLAAGASFEPTVTKHG